MFPWDLKQPSFNEVSTSENLYVSKVPETAKFPIEV